MQLFGLTIAVLICVCGGQTTTMGFPDYPLGPDTMTCDKCPPTSTCREMETYVYCDCPYGKTGIMCDEDDPCLPKTSDCPEGTLCFGMCNPNVVCNGATGIAQCSGCVAGWTGEDCRTDMNECEEWTDICQNGGTCVNLAGDYKCKCRSGWTGKDCETMCEKGTECDVQAIKEKEDSGNNSARNLQFSASLIVTLAIAVFSIL